MNGTAPADSPNPYASPLSEGEPVSDAEREIHAVIRVFRLIGWVGVILWTPAVFGSMGVFIYSLFAATRESSTFFFGVSIFHCSCAAIFLAYLRIASRMVKRRIEVRWKAILMCCLMLPGFPVFTVVGIICLWKVTRHYEAYCRERLDSQYARSLARLGCTCRTAA